MKTISILIPTYNEEDNIELLVNDITNITKNIKYKINIVFIDNNSTDKTRLKIKKIAEKNFNVKAIFNSKNFGHINSPFYGITQLHSDAVITISADYQDPIETIPLMIKKWEEGRSVVLLKKKTSKENYIMFSLRKFFYFFINFISETNLSKNTTGAGLYDKKIVSVLREMEEAEPYLRGLVHEITENIDYIEFDQPLRRFGKTKNNIFILFNFALTSIIKHSNWPIRSLTIVGIIFSFFSFLAGLFFLMYKLFFWNSFNVGIAPIIIGTFFGLSIQIFILGVLGEYISVILKLTRKKPLVIENERVNFDKD